MKLPTLKEISALPPDGRSLTVKGWVRTKRETKAAVFLEVNDGSRLGNLQCVFDEAAAAAAASELARAGTGASVAVEGSLVASPAAGQSVELRASSLRVIGEASPESYPLQKKAHSMEFLREIAHLRPRTNTFGAVARVRNRMAFAIHEFFQARGFQYVHTPLITASDCEGAGAMFQVTTLDLERLGKSGRSPDYGKDFFGKPAFLTVSGQLNVETYCEALGRVYTFGPTFRAENSNTSRHLSEFWMIEPEVAFAELADNMELAEDFLKHLVKTALADCAEDLGFFDQRVEKGLVESLEKVLARKFAHMTYTEAVAELEKAPAPFEVKPYWGLDLQSEHEKYLCEKIAGGPLFLTDYPKEIKSFYMKRNADGKTVRAMDLLVPRFGEIVGGSEREDRLEVLRELMAEKKMDESSYGWYLDLRRFGTTPHAGFGLGFERLVMYVTGMANIRDVIPFPRAPKLADF
ncbi:MAG TPA: asparagine--tRNA ligase [Spirochaetales bacterium]|nr:asparagine--tRNA ligase [Spirochaetales bacterium]HRZ65074.1 asparagine--tRNA ligase [Spirochaetia bacterium]